MSHRGDLNKIQTNNELDENENTAYQNCGIQLKQC